MQPEQQQRIMGYFIEEAKDHLNTIEQGLVNLQSTIEDSEMVNEVFRAAHSVKGGAAMLGINSIQRTSHRLEDCFKVLKECPVKIDQKLESLFLKVSDTLKELIEQLSGPFGLTEEIANGIMSGVEPVFEELNQHMAFLVNGAGGNVSLEAASGAQETGAATAAGGYLRDGQAQKRFQSDVLNQLREMLQLFKQTDQPRCRQQLQEICGSLERMGEQYECPKWSELIQASASAIANPENSYRTLATVVIKEIKQAQELVLAGRASSIEPSSQLNALLPSSATPSLLEQLDAEPSLIYSAQELAGATTADLQTRIASVQSQHSMTPAEAGTRQSRPKATDRFNYSETFIQEERFGSGESGAGLKEPSLTSANSDTTFSQPSIKSGRSKESANHPADPNGPEVGMAELNSLADLFEGEAPDLDETWQEEQVIGDGAENMGTERQEWLNLEQENDFSDLLGGDTDGLGKSATPATEEDDLTLFGFGEDLVEEGETPSAESEREDAAQLFAGSVSDGNGDEDDFSDLLFAADAPSAASEATPSENLANLWSDSFLEDEGFEQQENTNPLSESLAAATDEDLLGILTSENLDLALLATESEALESDSDEDLFGAAGIDTNENDSIEAAASQESSDWELMTTGTLFGEAAENSNQEVSEELETPSIMSIEGSDWTTDWSSEDLQVLDSVSAAEPIATTGNDLPDFVFEDEQSTSTALTGDLEMGSLLEDEVDLTAAGWEEEPDFSNLDRFETPHARADNGDVLEELMLDDNTDLWLEETMPRNEANDLLDLSAAIGTPFESEAIAPEIEADAVGDVNLDFNWPAIPGVEDIDASTSSVDRAFLEDWSATDLAWDETIQPAGFSEVTAAQMPGTAREDLEDWENQLEFNETLVEEPFSALDDLDIPSNWASPDAFALDTSASDARNEEALDLLELDNPQTSPFSLDGESEAESTGSEIENLALQEDADANGALNSVPNLTETVSVDELGDFFGSQAAELETTEFASLDESLDMNGESHEVPQLDALDNFFEAEPEATATTEWDSSLDFASMNLSDGNTNAFDASLGEPLSSLFDTSQEESLVSADASDDFFATTDAFLELPSEETSQGSLDAAENLETMLGDEPSSSTDALDALDLNEENLLATEFDAEWGIDSAAVPVDAAFELDEDLLDSSLPAEAPENLEAMFGEAPAPTPEALELADSDLFGSDMDDAEWGIDLAAVPVESDNLEAMFGEEASSAPTPEALELADSDLFSSETEAEWGIDLAAMPVESENLEAMFGEQEAPTPEALELADSDLDLFGSNDTEAEWGIDLAAVPVESENLEAMFGEEASSASTPEALELADLDLFSSDMDDAEWGIDSAAVSQEAASELEDLLGSEPVEFGDGLDFEENLLIGEIPSENQASDADELKEVDDLWDLVTEQQEIANPSEAAVLDELSLLETVGEQDQDLAISLVENDEFDELEAMLGEEVFAEPASNLASNDEFDELEALLGEEESVPAAFDAEDMNEFADLEALLGDDEPQLVPQFAQSQRSPTKPIAETATSADALDDGFGDLEELLGQAEETMGGPRSVKTSPGQVRPVNRPRPVKVFEQTMRVPVKHLDNLSNLVGELVVNRNTLEQDQERLRQFLDNLLHQVQQLSDVGARMQDRYERSLLESSLLASRQSNRFNARPDHTSAAQEAPANSRFGLGELELDLFTPFHSLSQEIIELIVRVRESAADIEFLVDETDQVARMLRQVTTQLQEGLTRSRMVPFAQTADRLPRAVREISLKCGKQAELQIEGRETLIDKVILEHLYDPMTHLVNNAITHGIEPPEVRIAAGKPPVGRITIRAFHQGNQTVISVSDDGAGIDSERVKAKAVEKGLITASEAKSMTRLEVYDLLFHPGFSTKDKADDFSGRGVGMDVVCTSLNEIRGVITTDSTLGKGTTFTVRLPLTLSICKALCCLSDKARIAFPMDGVEDMLDVPQDRIQTNSEGETCISWRDSLMPFQPLEELLTYQRHLSRGTVYGGNREDDMISVVVLRSAGNFIAVQVDQVLGEQEIVIKQLEGPVPKPLGVAGATVLGDGRIMPIADVLELIDLATGRIGKDRNVSLWDKAGVSLPVEAPAVKTDPMVLIVDDSITVRELLSMTFNKAGYRVEQARDGQEAWDKLRSGLPCEIVFCDIEMPRMDGLELLSRIQKDPSLNHLPVAMLTSRGASKHQQMAAQLGAKGYFTKPYLEEALLDAAQRMIKGEVLLSINTNA
ncbi:hybrid sensor histidine kinase/response regulator [Coleofasciculus sp. FACHB-SPT36]|uniref:hybrid sensor histidine kinase/response regulator n=1 Tax=Coleofasciculus sp. FACHB-SPT36 TaxID=2692790 RepID=UPI0018F04D0B|nr:hybrid sensor histidine kinase/response regulator [Coleofasciculus sp. FACHB-SPT36]